MASVDGHHESATNAHDVIGASAELTKDALSVIAKAAPSPIADSDVVKALVTMGYRATDNTRDAALAGLDAIETATGGSVVRKVSKSGGQALFEMNTQLAKAILKGMTRD